MLFSVSVLSKTQAHVMAWRHPTGEINFTQASIRQQFYWLNMMVMSIMWRKCYAVLSTLFLPVLKNNSMNSEETVMSLEKSRHNCCWMLIWPRCWGSPAHRLISNPHCLLLCCLKVTELDREGIKTCTIKGEIWQSWCDLKEKNSDHTDQHFPLWQYWLFELYFILLQRI